MEENGSTSGTGDEPKYQVLKNVMTNPENIATNGNQNSFTGYYQNELSLNSSYPPSNDGASESVSNAGDSEGPSYNYRFRNKKGVYQNSILQDDEDDEIDLDGDDGDSMNNSRSSQMYSTRRFTPPPPVPKKLGVLLDQERFLPIANVARIMKTRVESSAKLSKEAKECVQECVSEFISFIASEAADICNQTKRKTITADDLLTAMEATGFDNYCEPLKIMLTKYRQVHKITGPIHRPHQNYTRPSFYAKDPPIRPLFFDTDTGRKCTEQNVTNEGTNEWTEEQVEKLGSEQNIEQSVAETNYARTDIEQPTPNGELMIGDDVPITALEQQSQMQIYVDATTKQHYAAMETPEGLQLYPITIQSGPITLAPSTTQNQVTKSPYVYMGETENKPGSEAHSQEFIATNEFEEPTTSSSNTESTFHQYNQMIQQELQEFIVPNQETTSKAPPVAVTKPNTRQSKRKSK